jgi:hypothetical protein
MKRNEENLDLGDVINTQLYFNAIHPNKNKKKNVDAQR